MSLPTVFRYVFKAEVFPSEKRFNAVAKLHIRNLSPNEIEEVSLLLYPTLLVEEIHDKSGHAIFYSESKVHFPEDQGMRVNHILAKLNSGLAPGEDTSIEVRYSGTMIGYAETTQMKYIKDCISNEFSIIRPDSIAYPVVAHPDRKSFHSSYRSAFDYEVEITVPEGYTAAAGGTLKAIHLKDGMKSFCYENLSPTGRFDVTIAKYKMLQNSKRNISVYSLPEDADRASFILNEILRCLDFFTTLFGELRDFKGLSVIEIPIGFGSQGGNGYVLQTADCFKDPKMIYELYHEISHAWNITAKPQVARCRWFDEAFSCYFECLAIREFQGDTKCLERFESRRKRFIDAVGKNKKNYEIPVAQYGVHDLGDNSYTKGAWVLCILEHIVGRNNFIGALRDFYQCYRDREADFMDFKYSMEKSTGVELTHFFNEWIYGTESSKYLVEQRSPAEIAMLYRG